MHRMMKILFNTNQNTIMNQLKKYIKIALFSFFFAALFNHLEAQTKKVPYFSTPQFEHLEKSHKVQIIIPAYNEENRIEKTITEYVEYFRTQKMLKTSFLIVANNCSDKTVAICRKLQQKFSEIEIMDLKAGGKGFAVKEGFSHSIKNKSFDLIGFVDADLATTPPYFYELITKIKDHDGAIASRYVKGARVWPKRPFLKRIGGKIYNFVLRNKFNIPFKDTQCGAKIFKSNVIESIAPFMQEKGWAFDLELLYLCQIFDAHIVEVPTTWSDMPGSHLSVSGSSKEFLSAPGRIKKAHANLARKKKSSTKNQKKVSKVKKQRA